jgi:hypothetical protein
MILSDLPFCRGATWHQRTEKIQNPCFDIPVSMDILSCRPKKWKGLPVTYLVHSGGNRPLGWVFCSLASTEPTADLASCTRYSTFEKGFGGYRCRCGAHPREGNHHPCSPYYRCHKPYICSYPCLSMNLSTSTEPTCRDEDTILARSVSGPGGCTLSLR